MKKVNLNLLRWLRLRSQRQDSRARRNARKARHSTLVGEASSKRTRTTVLALPHRIAADHATDRAQLYVVLRSLAGVLRSSGARVKLDFTQTTKMYPGGMLLLLAYLELLLESYPGRIRAKCVNGSLAAQLLSHCRFAHRLGIDTTASTPRHESVITWKYLTGHLAEGQKVRELLDSYRAFDSARIPEGLYDVLTEALTNVRHHAYPDSGSVPTDLHRWWLFSRFSEPTANSAGSIYIAVYDVGIGIQSSLRSRLATGERILDSAGDLLSLVGVGGNSIERHLLHAAVEGRRSSTGLGNRGYGLPEMREFVLRSGTGTLSIVSGMAQYTCLAEVQSSSAYRCSDPTLGTLILWHLPLQWKEPSS